MTANRVIPVGRDRLGILGSVFGLGTNPALIGTDSEYAIGLEDAAVFCRITIEGDQVPVGTIAYCVQIDGGAVNFAFGYVVKGSFAGRLALYISGFSTFYSDVIPNFIGSLHDIGVVLDRSANAHFICDGDVVGAVSIAAASATNIDSTTCRVGSKIHSSYPMVDLVTNICLYIFGVDNGPTPDEVAVIANEQFVSPDAESPTLLQRTNIDAERRLYVDLVDPVFDATTVTNRGTGSDPTIGGSKNLNNVVTLAEKAEIVLPDEDWYCADSTHGAGPTTADLGCVKGSYILEAVYRDCHVPITAQGYIWRLNNGAAEQFYLYHATSLDNYSLVLTSNGVNKFWSVWRAGLAEYGRLGIYVVHQVYDAVAKKYYIIINGQIVRTYTPIADDLDLSGSISIYFSATTMRDGLVALRLWNAPIPAGWTDEILHRVTNPWVGSDLYGKTLADGLKGEWLGKASAQKASSTVLVNQPQPGVADLLISAGASWGTSRVLAVAGQ